MTTAEKARQLYQQGVSAANIAKQLNCHYSAVHSAIKSLKQRNFEEEDVLYGEVWNLRQIKQAIPLTAIACKKAIERRGAVSAAIKDQELSDAINQPSTQFKADDDGTVEIWFLQGRITQKSYEAVWNFSDERIRRCLWEDLVVTIDKISHKFKASTSNGITNEYKTVKFRVNPC